MENTAKILIVDDMTAMLVALRRALAHLGFTNVIEAESGAEALAALQANPDIALIISDWNMEPMDGLELLGAVREHGQISRVPFVLASAEADDALTARAKNCGVSCVLTKPFDASALKRALASLA
jgi:two-component system, chemotaxis family, chemotaxis protein CheY